MTNANPLTTKCSICDKDDNLMRCARYRVTYYCRREHQSSHFASHKSACGAVANKRTKYEDKMRNFATSLEMISSSLPGPSRLPLATSGACWERVTT